MEGTGESIYYYYVNDDVWWWKKKKKVEKTLNFDGADIKRQSGE